ncbi:MAG TPA: 4Fe-4S binding protein [Planctomycetota bacterium]|jgi:ferredoxin
MSLDLFLKTKRNGSSGLLRRSLKRLSSTWAYSPVRRIVQTLCFALFVILFFYVCWPYSAQPGHYADELRGKEVIDAESFLALDPLVSISAALAAKAWVWSLAWAAALLAACLVFTRGFCGYVCPMGTLIDLFDWVVGKRVKRFRTERRGWWVNLKYYVLLGTLLAALRGVTLSGWVAAIPVLTRGMQFIFAPLQMGSMRGWHQVPYMNPGHTVSIVLFVAVLALGLLQPRFWCRYVCPSGAIFSVFNLFRLSERKVIEACTECGKCVKACPFDAINADVSTRTADCTFCQTCGGACPEEAIHFTSRWQRSGGRPRPLSSSDGPSRRGFLVASGSALLVAWIARKSSAGLPAVVRPPGSLPEAQFLSLCVRCGECFKVCPNNVLQPAGFERGVDELWTPKVVANWSGCEASCNACGQVCPTGAIRPLPLDEKKCARMGRGIVDLEQCLPHAGSEACQMCVDECKSAGYDAIEFMRVRVETDDNGLPVEGSGFAAPVVLADKCVGCGLCQTRCYQINVKSKHLLGASAIIIEAGEGKEDRLVSGSYRELRAKEAAARTKKQTEPEKYLPDFLK